MKIYCIAEFGSFPNGLLDRLNAIASNSDDVDVIAGILDGDENVNDHGAPDPAKYTLDQRQSLLSSLKSVASVVNPSPSVLTESFLKDQKIDAVYHLVPSDSIPNQTVCEDHHDSKKGFAVPTALGIFHTIGFDSGTQVYEEPGWDKVWETKGKVNDQSNTRLLTGYEETDFEPQQFAERWAKAIQWKEGETVLDVGCGAGFLGDYLPSKGYIGLEKSQAQADNFIQRSGRVVIVQDATTLPFKDGSFDHVVSHSMLEYMPGKPAAIQAIKEMQRVARKTVFLGDLRSAQHSYSRPDKYVIPGIFAHCLFQKNEFADRKELDEFVLLDRWWGPSTRFNAMYRKNEVLHLAIIGGGPAGCSLLTNYALNDEYEELLDSGVAIFDSSQHLGGGSLCNYSNLRSNSHGCAFFDAITALDIQTHDKSLNIANEIPMEDMKKLQVAIGSWHQQRLSQHPMSRSISNTTVLDITEMSNGMYSIRYSTKKNSDAKDCTVRNVLANNVCICTGGIPYIPEWVLQSCDAKRLELALDYFTGKNLELKGPRIAVVGFSHSAFSIGHLLQNRHPSSVITYIKQPSSTRTQPLIYFPSTEAANQNNYDYENADVDPETGRVHRFGGLRGDARTFALTKDSYQTSNVLNPDDYNHIIVACGFRMKTIPMFDRNGVELCPDAEWSGTSVDSDGRLFSDHQIYAFGLGAGLHPNQETGGEPGCTRRADGIWLYQYTVGSIIRNSIKQRATEWRRIYNRIASNATVNTPLHHIGGYNMFSQGDWDNQVRMLLEGCTITNLNSSTKVFESGCGGGAFLDSLSRLYGCKELEGCDQASGCVDIANRRLKNGTFWVGDVSTLSRVPDTSKDFSFMFGVTPYLNDVEHVEQSINELIRITKKGGVIMIAENNDLERKDVADCIRRRTHKNPSNHLFLSSSFWKRFSNAEVFDHATMGLENPMAPYRNSVVIRKQ